ncbi:MAG: DUF1015 domain-containing protein [Synergistaceae bacterium]|nr:DUF1015 domain-containing protein [Synergistaceae bacterium]
MSCFKAADIYLPNKDVDLKKWSVVACDQFTSDPTYWELVEHTVADAPSTLYITLPEIYLKEAQSRIPKIAQNMEDYVASGVLVPAVKDGFVLVERDTSSGKRLGIVGAIDLEAYDFNKGAEVPVRCTEGTVAERLPVRTEIRSASLLECPHVMLLIDDPKKTLIESFYDKRESFRVLYDVDLMKQGGHLKGYALEGQTALEVEHAFAEFYDKNSNFFLAVGDGNHSLAAAKICWENIKKTLTDDDQKNHPARFALVEVVNLHSPALVFKPIHRIVSGVGLKEFTADFESFLERKGMKLVEGTDLILVSFGKKRFYDIKDSNGRLPVDIVQEFLDKYMQNHPHILLDYIHGSIVTEGLSQKIETVGILLQPISKDGFFDAIEAGGALPRKTFSMGEAEEKKYYMECRKIR